MTSLVALAVGIAAIDWIAVYFDRPAVEALAKPAVMVVLIAAALVADAPGSVRVLIVVGLAFGLVGDVMLLPAVNNFIAGLGAFLIGHLAYGAAFVAAGQEAVPLAIGVVAAAALALTVGRPVLAAVAPTPLAWPVRAYFLVISVMVATAIGAGSAWFGVGAFVFALSDALLGTDKFVTPRLDRRVFVHVLYHLGQASIVAGLHWS